MTDCVRHSNYRVMVCRRQIFSYIHCYIMATALENAKLWVWGIDFIPVSYF